MCSFIYSSKIIKNSLKANEYSKLRGPDGTSEFKVPGGQGHHFIHNLLSITGAVKEQPFVDDGIYCVFNGEIYNYKTYNSSYESDGESIIDLYKQFGYGFVKALDGEYAIVILDLKKNILFATTDIFATKPLWIGRRTDGAVGAATYQSSLTAEGYEKIQQVPPNTSLVINLEDMSLVERANVYEFDLTQHKKDYDGWIAAFENSIKKRSNSREKIFIGLSGGYDSGAIACELLKQNVEFKSFSIAAAEDLNIIHARRKMIKSNNFTKLSKVEYDQQKLFLEKFSEKYYSPPRRHRPHGYLVTNDKGAVGTGIICEQARKEGYKIYLSGQGSDEVISDYGHNGRMATGFLHGDLAGNFPPDLKTVFPWTNFFRGTQREFLYKDEAVGGTYGIECRYPFLDKNLVQEFLWLNSDLKNCYYKAPIREYLNKNSFPFKEGLSGKVGFRANSF